MANSDSSSAATNLSITFQDGGSIVPTDQSVELRPSLSSGNTKAATPTDCSDGVSNTLFGRLRALKPRHTQNINKSSKSQDSAAVHDTSSKMTDPPFSSIVYQKERFTRNLNKFNETLETKAHKQAMAQWLQEPPRDWKSYTRPPPTGPRRIPGQVEWL